MTSQRWVREPEARAHMGNISHGAFYALVRDGLIKPIRVGRSCFFDLGDIDSFMEGLKVEQHGEARRTA